MSSIKNLQIFEEFWCYTPAFKLFYCAAFEELSISKFSSFCAHYNTSNEELKIRTTFQTLLDVLFFYVSNRSSLDIVRS